MEVIVVSGGIYDNSNFAGVEFTNEKLAGASFKNCNLRGCSFVDCNLRGCDFTNSDLSGALFNKSDIDGITLTNAITKGCDFIVESENKWEGKWLYFHGYGYFGVNYCNIVTIKLEKDGSYYLSDQRLDSDRPPIIGTFHEKDNKLCGKWKISKDHSAEFTMINQNTLLQVLTEDKKLYAMFIRQS